MTSAVKRRLKTESSNSKSKKSNSTSSYPLQSLFMEPSPSLFPSKAELVRLLAVVAIASSVALACNYAFIFLNRQPKPFCDSDLDSDNSLSDICEPCPNNGICYEGKLKCIHGYRKHGKSCIEDGDINETAKKLSELVKTHVCEAYAQYLCEGTGTIWVHEDGLWNNFDELKLMENYGLDKTIYKYVKQKAMEIVGKLLVMRTNTRGIKELKCPDFLVDHYKPVTCCIQQWIAQHALVLISVCALLVGCTLILLRVRQRRHLSVRAEQLYNKVCDILENNALSSKRGNGEVEPWVVASWLRDYLLSPKERKDRLLWKKVEELVQEDSRLDLYPRIVKGESKIVWEWQVEGSLSSSGKRRNGEQNKLRSGDGISLRSNQQFQPLKDEPLNC